MLYKRILKLKDTLHGSDFNKDSFELAIEKEFFAIRHFIIICNITDNN